MNGMIAACLMAASVGNPGLAVKSTKIAGASVSYVVIDPKLYAAKVVTGKGNVGSLDSLRNMANRHKAVAAINGAFFDAYSNNPIRNTVQTMISDGMPINMSDIGVVFGMNQEGKVRIDPLKIRIRGKVGNQSWYAFRANNDPLSKNLAQLFTTHWGDKTGLSGLQVQISDGQVRQVSRSSVTIPAGGYVLYFKGTEESMGSRFKFGDKVSMTIDYGTAQSAFWEGVTEGMGGGPTLVRGGKDVLDAESEGFRDPKILSGSGSRTLLGIMPDGQIVLAVSAGTMTKMVAVMRGLGCSEAMNLDGGASSGMIVNGKSVRAEGRPLANALVFTKR